MRLVSLNETVFKVVNKDLNNLSQELFLLFLPFRKNEFPVNIILIIK